MKRIITLAISFGLLATMFIGAPSSAADKPKKNKKIDQISNTLPSCTQTTSVGHTPLKLKMPSIKKLRINKLITFETNCGEIEIATDGVSAPLTVISMTYLVRRGFLDNSPCHRLTTRGIFVLQCGDPTASGSGGPAWEVPDENLPIGSGNIYPAGSVAMANSGPNTNGSQFFIVYDDYSRLGPNYTLWGRVIRGLDIVKAIAALGSDNSYRAGDGFPVQPITIERAIVR